MAANKVMSEAAQKEQDLMESHSSLAFMNETMEEVTWGDVDTIGSVGNGSFSNVFEVHLKAEGFDPSENYALKCVAYDRLKTQQEMTTAARDLVVEGEILSRIQHENIVQLKAVTAGGPEKAFLQSHSGYFLILSLLDHTLADRLKTCRKKGFKSYFKSSTFGDFHKVITGIARGLNYLHENNIVLRDLKPDNIGFDSEGTPKIFDLGLAREAHMIPENEVAGSLRYMAPEVCLGKATELKSDVYSLGLLLWELCTLKIPFEEFKKKEDFTKAVIVEGVRPSLSLVRSNLLKSLIGECWDQDFTLRPTSSAVLNILEGELLDEDLNSSGELDYADDFSVTSIGSKTKKLATSIKKFSIQPLKKYTRAQSEPAISKTSPISGFTGIERRKSPIAGRAA